ncbi:ribosomal L7Ae/L30e/S12e/Gadd45 family protein [Candidatus Woesearchaeota archaeon]|nr:MAG: hypothetical protein QS99_C0004G0030 [archaeon GW2011_AR4]MBS3129489.1 ribosomal L7Ae/L30e/S12e/Gadd45 family protein [Candidatus Woesearchaeota archaeon]HIH38870.1 hypothetical protein [Candidatus Woesearchaeota archaeon]HIH49114.1 hypothetical protein [Candidatus Woesearchaeota archaeon]HIJ03776.1 hypothetical protein [Candidatus Woesearchaeota archaeon]
MAKAQDKTVKDIKALLEKKKILIGTKTTLKALRAGKLAKAFLAINCSEATKEDLRHYTTGSSVEVVQTHLNSEELGVVCKKSFTVSLLGVLK